MASVALFIEFSRWATGATIQRFFTFQLTCGLADWLFACDLINSDHHLHPILLIRFRVSFFFCYTAFIVHLCLIVFCVYLSIATKPQRKNEDNAFCHLNTSSVEFVIRSVCIEIQFCWYWLLNFDDLFQLLRFKKRDKILENWFKFLCVWRWGPFLISKTLRSIFVISKLCLLFEPPL